MEESQEKEHQQELLLELESAAGDTTPLSMPSLADEESSSSPEDAVSAGDKPPMEVFDLQESSSDAGSPEMEQEKLFIKLKEVRVPVVVVTGCEGWGLCVNLLMLAVLDFVKVGVEGCGI